MKMFSYLYNIVMQWAAHPRAPYYLSALSFAESSFFPIPPDAMLAPMVLAKRSKAWFYASITTIASALGGVFGYLIGYFAFDAVAPFIQETHYWAHYETATEWFAEWGVWVVFIAGFSPIPYKVFTLSAGAVSMAFLPFLICSIVGRGLRFFLVAGLMYWGGEKMEKALRIYVDRIGWAVIILAIVAYVVAQFL